MSNEYGGPGTPGPFNVVDILPMDMQDIREFEHLVAAIPLVNSINAPEYMQKFLRAKDLASRHYATAKFSFSRAKDRAKRLWAYARLEKAKDKLSEKKLKVTDANCDAFADMDAEYLAAKEEQNYFESLSDYMLSKMWMFQNAHSDVQAIFRQTSDPVGSITSMGDKRYVREGDQYGKRQEGKEELSENDV